MKTSAVALLSTSVVALAIAAGCGSGSSNGASGSYSLSSGAYQYVATATPTNSCWAPPKATISLPMTITATLTVNGNSILVTGSAGGQTASFNATRSGNALAGSSSSVVDLSTTTLALDCQLKIDGTLTGTVTGNDAFDATNTITISQQSGTQCSSLVGNTFDQQVDALPCTLSLAGHATKQ